MYVDFDTYTYACTCI